MKKIWNLFVAGVLITGIYACSNSPSTSSATTEKEETAALTEEIRGEGEKKMEKPHSLVDIKGQCVFPLKDIDLKDSRTSLALDKGTVTISHFNGTKTETCICGLVKPGIRLIVDKANSKLNIEDATGFGNAEFAEIKANTDPNKVWIAGIEVSTGSNLKFIGMNDVRGSGIAKPKAQPTGSEFHFEADKDGVEFYFEPGVNKYWVEYTTAASAVKVSHKSSKIYDTDLEAKLAYYLTFYK